MILCAGEALIDLIPNEAGAAQPFVGGAVLNTAVALGRLGQEVGLISGLSSDDYGQLIEETLQQSHVSLSYAVRSNRPTTQAVVRFEDGHAAYDFRDAGSAMRELTFEDLPSPPPQTRALFYGGISLCNPPVADALAAHFAAHAPKHLTMMDPNVRPGFAEDQASYLARLRTMLEQVDIVKVSDDDLAGLYPGKNQDECIATLLKAGPRLVLLTLGAEGARAVHANGATAVAKVTPATTGDTIGAGDTFNAAFLASASEQGLLDKDALDHWTPAQLTQMLDFGTRAAAITVSRDGANPPWAHELKGTTL